MRTHTYTCQTMIRKDRLLDCACASWTPAYWEPEQYYTLTTSEMADVRRFAKTVYAKRHGSRQVGGAEKRDGGDERLHVEGFSGELALARLTRVPYEFQVKDQPDDIDVGPDQVKTRSSHRYDLMVWQRNPIDTRYALFTGVAPQLYARGWQDGRFIKQERWWGQPPGTAQPAYFVPVEYLHRFPFHEPEEVMSDYPRSAWDISDY